MTDTNKHPDCPYGAGICPKLTMYDERIRTLEKNQGRMMQILYVLVGITTATLGVSII